jgi:hypothetical protein
MANIVKNILILEINPLEIISLVENKIIYLDSN